MGRIGLKTAKKFEEAKSSIISNTSIANVENEILRMYANGLLPDELQKLDYFSFAEMVVNGYEIADTPEERLRDYYEEMVIKTNKNQQDRMCKQKMIAVHEVLEILGREDILDYTKGDVFMSRKKDED